MNVVYSTNHLLHDPSAEMLHGRVSPAYEIPSRAEAIRVALSSDDLFRFEPPVEHGTEPITAVHDKDLLAYLEGAWAEWREVSHLPQIVSDTFRHPAMREGMGEAPLPTHPLSRIAYWTFDTSTPIVPGTYRAARSAVDVAMTAAGMVLDGEAAAYGLCRPPGHHSPRAAYGGYCFFNNAAIAAEHIARTTGEPVAILDVDYHHGNGTQQIFYSRGDVLYVSLHGDPARAYPYFAGYANETGAGSGEGTTLNFPLTVGCDDERYLETIDRALQRIGDFGGSTIVVSLGFDTYGQDPICDLGLTTPVYHEIGLRVAALGRKLLILQEGGYFVPRLGENARQWLRGVAGLPLDVR